MLITKMPHISSSHSSKQPLLLGRRLQVGPQPAREIRTPQHHCARCGMSQYLPQGLPCVLQVLGELRDHCSQ